MRPYAPTSNTTPTFQEFWLAAYLAALHRVEPIAARMIADEAVQVAHERWKNAPTVECWDYWHNYPLGHQTKDDLPSAST
ncbi:hypothetical protein [Burkholderia gladioli]|uniref:hypothetical protein n=1 Tax=Burkholderia gladioli TaxID=28095 RepID=UPI002FE29193